MAITHLPSSLKEFIINFENELSKSQFDNFQSWVVGILDGRVEATKISKFYSDKHPSSLTRFMNSESWNDSKLNGKESGGFVWGQQLLTSHIVLADTDFPLFVDLYRKKDEVEDEKKFRSKIQIAQDHIKKFPKIEGRQGVVITDT